MPQKNPSIMFTLLGSVFMMMLVSSVFHLPTQQTNGAITSSFFEIEKATKIPQISSTAHYGSIDPLTIRPANREKN